MEWMWLAICSRILIYCPERKNEPIISECPPLENHRCSKPPWLIDVFCNPGYIADEKVSSNHCLKRFVQKGRGVEPRRGEQVTCEVSNELVFSHDRKQLDRVRFFSSEEWKVIIVIVLFTVMCTRDSLKLISSFKNYLSCVEKGHAPSWGSPDPVTDWRRVS